jgi:hypothetical protein
MPMPCRSLLWAQRAMATGMLWPRAGAHQLTTMASQHLTMTYTGWPDTRETCYMPCYNTTDPALRTAACYIASHATACEDSRLVPVVPMAMSGATHATPTNAATHHQRRCKFALFARASLWRSSRFCLTVPCFWYARRSSIARHCAILALLLLFRAVAASTSQCTAKLRDLPSGIVPGTNITRVATRFVFTASCGRTLSIACSTIFTASFSWIAAASVLVLSLLSPELVTDGDFSVCLAFCRFELTAISRTNDVLAAVLHACRPLAKADVP